MFSMLLIWQSVNTFFREGCYIMCWSLSREGLMKTALACLAVWLPVCEAINLKDVWVHSVRLQQNQSIRQVDTPTHTPPPSGLSWDRSAWTSQLHMNNGCHNDSCSVMLTWPLQLMVTLIFFFFTHSLVYSCDGHKKWCSGYSLCSLKFLHPTFPLTLCVLMFAVA